MVKKLLLLLFLISLSSKSVLAVDITLNIDTSSNLGTISPIWSSTVTWKPWMWYSTPMVSSSPSRNWFTDYFPFYDSVRVMASIGGNIDPAVGPYCNNLYSCNMPETLKEDGSLDFSYIDKAMDNIRNSGLYPTLDLAQTPKFLALNPALVCDGFKFYSSSVNDVGKWKNFVASVLDHFVGRYGGEVSSKWGFSSFNEPDLGNPGVSNCSFSGTTAQFINDILKPTVSVLKDRNLLSNFHLGAMTFVDNVRLANADVDTQNEAVGSDIWMSYLLSNLTAAGYSKNDFKSFALNMYGIYPDRHSIFWIKRSIDTLKTMLGLKGYGMPIRADELGIIHNNNSNTRVYESPFAASWFASVFKIYLDSGNVDKINSWWYLLVKDGRTFDQSKWKRTLAYYTFLMFNQLSNTKRLSVSGGVFDEQTLFSIDGVAGKDSQGIIKVILFNHHDGLSGASADSDPNAPIIDRNSRDVKVIFNNLEEGSYRLSKFQATDENIATSPKDLPLIESIDLNLTSTFEKTFNVPHHSVILLKLEKNKTVLKKGWNKISTNLNSSISLPCVNSFKDVGFWRKGMGIPGGNKYLRCFNESIN